MSPLMSSRSATELASVVATGVALKPAASSPFTRASLPATETSESVENRNLSSKPSLPLSARICFAFAGSVWNGP